MNTATWCPGLEHRQFRHAQPEDVARIAGHGCEYGEDRAVGIVSRLVRRRLDPRLDGEVGAAVEFGTFDNEKLPELTEKYAEMQDAFNAAKLGCVDNIIEPEFVRQYVISALETIVR